MANILAPQLIFKMDRMFFFISNQIVYTSIYNTVFYGAILLSRNIALYRNYSHYKNIRTRNKLRNGMTFYNQSPLKIIRHFY